MLFQLRLPVWNPVLSGLWGSSHRPACGLCAGRLPKILTILLRLVRRGILLILAGLTVRWNLEINPTLMILSPLHGARSRIGIPTFSPRDMRTGILLKHTIPRSFDPGTVIVPISTLIRVREATMIALRGLRGLS